MKVTSALVIGNGTFTFEVEDQDDMTALVNSITLASPRPTCNVCGAEGLDTKSMLAYRTKEGYKYVKVHCDECGARSPLGQYRDGDGFFWKEFEVYRGDQSENAADHPESPAHDPADDEPISPDAVDALDSLMDDLAWAIPHRRNHLAKHYRVSKTDSLSMGQGRQLYRELQRELKQKSPF